MFTSALPWLSVRRVNEIPNLTGVRARPRRCVRDDRVEPRRRLAAATVVRRLGQPVEQRRAACCSRRPGRSGWCRAPRRRRVPPADLERVEAQVGRDLLDDVLDRRDPLRAAEAAHRRVRREVGAADRPRDGEVGDEVGVVGVEHRALHDGQRQVGRAAAVGVQLEVQGVDPPLGVEADLVAGQIRMPLARDPHVQVAGVDDPRRPAGARRRPAPPAGAGWAACDSLPPNPPPIRVQTQTTWFWRRPRQCATTLLDLAGVLRRRVDGDLPGLAGDRQRGLGLQVEMLLAAGAEGPLEDVLGLRQRGRGVSPRDPSRRADEVAAGDRLVDRQDGGQRLQLDPDRRPGRAEGRPALARQRDDGLADVMALARGQHLLVVEDRAEPVVAGHVGRGEHARDPLDLARPRPRRSRRSAHGPSGCRRTPPAARRGSGGMSSRYTAWPVTWACADSWGIGPADQDAGIGGLGSRPRSAGVRERIGRGLAVRCIARPARRRRHRRSFPIAS